jgi:hypothetical protein
MQAPLLDADLGLGAMPEPLQREVSVAQRAVERFVDAVLPGPARVDEGRPDLGGLQPAENRPCDELRPIVGAEVPWGEFEAEERRREPESPTPR